MDAERCASVAYVPCDGARRIAVSALAVGAMLKDLYRLPRPPETLVWRASVANDATNAKDYGFVSTHTTNAVTNAGCTVL